MELCFATNNRHKLEEVTKAFNDNIRILSLKELSVFDELPETQNTLEGNALQKAQFVFDKLKIPCFADDSGLEVEALNGDPGVYSAHYAGPQRDSDNNIDLLLKNLNNIQNRKAKFRTVIALIGLGETTLFEGSVNGNISHDRKGNGGFGYDPVFIPDGFSKSFAEMSLDEKNTLSHRAIAVRKLVQHIKTMSSNSEGIK
jgi:XTP/dITP diphosphohydrolase